jgi:hypothetical protein
VAQSMWSTTWAVSLVLFTCPLFAYLARQEALFSPSCCAAAQLVL